ncbi:flagellar assembly peptidoglycan hydrolase FlgJ [Halomonas vilamensis]|uniref:Peptidoglycan hydrolase FlgJ n=1 Tax=Vreelandella vilamensis TaxID=531309 RepID=A0ABU1H383_9GAMM|nr:flagellar assembly peptidoglycan hydrolase FlgJ [Halomonas vilamensis]MDR5898751.1 flagellar assembly peptidoglycan hydrolase FlgJ [Halomonas vilamensis]
MSVNQDMTGQFALDMQGFQRLQHTARVDPEKGVESAAQQFEAIFVQMMVKSMRDAIPTSGLMSSSQTDFYQSMMDKQWSQVIASRGMGLADALVDQLERQGAFTRSEPAVDSDNAMQELIAGIPRGTPRELNNPGPLLADDNSGAATQTERQSFLAELDAVRQAAPSVDSSTLNNERASVPVNGKAAHDHVEQFKQTLMAPAQAASEATGVPAELILAQAALETGWGRHEITTQDGRNSHNLFGIKAGSRWEGDTTDIVTHEYVNGRRTEVTDTFRVYDSFEQAFTDYASLIGNNPRYANVVTASDAHQAARELQAGGYATDPRYADKLVAVMQTLDPTSSGDLLASSR